MVLFSRFLVIALFGFFPILIQAHSGGLNKEGCHNNRKTGDYHCHGAPAATPAPAVKTSPRTMPAPQAPATVLPSYDYSTVDAAPVLKRFSGKVVGVHDGDTISVMHGSQQEKIRIFGIDCPEDGQAFSNKAKQFTSQLSFNQVVTVIPNTVDVYGRTVADIILPDGRSLGHEIVKTGLAWWFQKYAQTDQPLRDLEAQAKVAGLGLWIEKNAMPPWQFRKPGEPMKSQEATPAAAMIDLLNLTSAHVSKPASETVYITKTGAKYHRAGCRHLRSIISVSLSDAKSKGYSACSVCRP